MKTINQWFDEYAVSHQNETNISIHFICVPAIYFSIIGLLLSINNNLLLEFVGDELVLIANWAFIIMIPVMIFYLRLSFVIFIRMALFSMFCIIGNYYLAQITPILYVSLGIFIVAWIGQFYGHKIEGKKPSFLKDLQFLLIGPVWVLEKMLGNSNNPKPSDLSS